MASKSEPFFGPKGKFWDLDHFTQKFHNTLILYKGDVYKVCGVEFDDDNSYCGSSYNMTGYLYKGSNRQTLSIRLDDEGIDLKNFTDMIGGVNAFLDDGSLVGALIKRKPRRYWKQGICHDNLTITENPVVGDGPRFFMDMHILATSISDRLSQIRDDDTIDKLSLPELISSIGDRKIQSLYWNGILFYEASRTDGKHSLFFTTDVFPKGILTIDKDGTNASIQMFSREGKFSSFLDEELSFVKEVSYFNFTKD